MNEGLEEATTPVWEEEAQMKEDQKNNHPIWLNLLSLIASVIVGMGSAYLTANATLASLQVKVDRNENDIAAMSKDRERLIRVETKLDVIILNVSAKND